MKSKTIYICEICGVSFETPELAASCEATSPPYTTLIPGQDLFISNSLGGKVPAVLERWEVYNPSGIAGDHAIRLILQRPVFVSLDGRPLRVWVREVDVSLFCEDH